MNDAEALVNFAHFCSPAAMKLVRISFVHLLFALALLSIVGCHRDDSPSPVPATQEQVAESSDAVLVTPARKALLVVGSTSLTGGDLALNTRLSSVLGFTVTVKDSTALATDANGMSLVVISESVVDTTVGNKFKSVAVPALVLEPLIFDDMGMTATALNTDFGTKATQSQVTITSATHPMAAGLTGTVGVLTSGTATFGWGKPASTASSVANIVGTTTSQTAIFGYTTGTTMAQSVVAPARRVGWFASAAAIANFGGADGGVTNGWKLFDAAVAWATQQEAVLVTNSTTLTTGETAIQNRLTGSTMNMAVRVIAASTVTAAAIPPAKVVIISDTVNATTLSNKLTDVATPIVCLQAASYNWLGLTGTKVDGGVSKPDAGVSGTDFGTSTGQTQLDIAKAGHALAAGLTGTVTVTSPGQTFEWGKTLAPSAIKIANIRGSADAGAANALVAVFGYPQGVTRADGVTTQARRVGFFASSAATTAFSGDAGVPNGWKLFEAAVNWAKDTARDDAGCESKADGAACNDNNACTQTDTCQNQVCVGSNPKTCTASDQCHVAGTCNPSTGACSNPNANNGTSCNDGNACTQSDTCQNGVCTGANPVTCTASDQCHVAGTCNPANGQCSNPNATNGTSCNDGNACTQTDTCQSGVCTGSNPKTCTASDQCHVAGTCNPANGQCSNPNANNGTACNDGNACTQTDTCQSGVCTGSNPKTCAAIDQCHVAGTCNPASGVCSTPSANNGTACNDGNACTQTDTCQNGACTGANPITCTAADDCHDPGTCNPANGTCTGTAKPDGTACDDHNTCTPSSTCHSGTCTGTSATNACSKLVAPARLTATVTASSSAAGFAASQAGDGNNATEWVASLTASPSNNNAWIQLDFGAQKQIERVRWLAAAGTPAVAQGPANYTIATSDDGVTWSPPVATRTTSGVTNGNEFVGKVARYVRLTTTKVFDGAGSALGMYEFWADGTAYATGDTLRWQLFDTFDQPLSSTRWRTAGNGTVTSGTGKLVMDASATGSSVEFYSLESFYGRSIHLKGLQEIAPGAGRCWFAGNVANRYWGPTLRRDLDFNYVDPSIMSDLFFDSIDPKNGTNFASHALTDLGSFAKGPVLDFSLGWYGTTLNIDVAKDGASVLHSNLQATSLLADSVIELAAYCGVTLALDEVWVGPLLANTNCAITGCAAADQCHDAGICDVTTGLCSNPPKATGAACDDANGCTATEVCSNGGCAATQAVACSAPDTCHNPGTCNAASGVCSNPIKAAPCASQLDVDDVTHVIGGAVTATWSGFGAAQRDDYVGLYASPSDPNYQPLNFHYICPNRPPGNPGPCSVPLTSGSLPLGIPVNLAPGVYHLRLVSATGTTLATTQTFSIVNCSSPGTQCAKLDANLGMRGAFAGGGLTAQWSGDHAPRAQDFIGLYRVGTNDKYAPLNLRFTKGTAGGTLQFNLPADVPTGQTYELRLGSEDSYEPIAKSAPFTVNACTAPGTDCAALQVVGSGHPVHVLAGSAITVNWGGIGGPDSADIVGLYPPGADLNGYKTFHYTNGMASGTMMLNVPFDTAPGTFDVRLAQLGEWTTLLAKDAVVVDPRPADGTGVANVSIDATKPYPGGAVQVTWSGVGAPRAQDFVGIYIPGDSKWNPKSVRFINGQAGGMVALDVPADLPIGRYEVRLSAEDSYEPIAIATGAHGFDVRACPQPGIDCASVTVAQTSAAAGRAVSVTWKGVQAPDANDVIAVYRAGDNLAPLPAGFASTGGTAGGTLSLTLPANLAPGDYEARILYAGGYYALLATSSPTFSVERDCVGAGNACPAIDDCHSAGVCSAATGVCTKPAKANGSACDDHNPCSMVDTCQAGRCVGGSARICTARDQCHLAGTCDRATGLCSDPTKKDGALCDDGNDCTKYDVCESGSCAGSMNPLCAGAPKSHVEDLGTFGGDLSAGYGINDQGVTVGFGWEPTSNYVAARWFPGDTTAHRLNDDPRAAISSAHAINNAGVIAGRVFVGRPARYSDAGGWQLLGPDTAEGYGVAINDSNSMTGFDGTHAFRYTDTTPYVLLDLMPGWNRAWGYGIDNDNNVVGDALVPPGVTQWDNTIAFRHTFADNTPHDLTREYAPPGWILRTARGTNGDEIVGFATHEDGKVQAYRLTISTHRVEDLGTLVAGNISQAFAINKEGAVTGSSYVNQPAADVRAFVWTELLGMVQLDKTIDEPDHWRLEQAIALNNEGDIVGSGHHDGLWHGFRMHLDGIKRANVPRCTLDTQCGTGFCSEGVCCDVACKDPCSSCRLPGSIGICTPKPEGATCTDGNACTEVDTCRGGRCVPGPQAACAPLDECHVAGTCDTASGACSFPAKPDGATCASGNGNCRSGTCTVAGAGVIRYRANADPTTLDGYVSELGDQFWQVALTGGSPLGRSVLDGSVPAWELDTSMPGIPTGLPHEESWSIVPVDQDLDLAEAKGWTLRARLRLPTIGDVPGSGAAVYYNARDRLFSMEFGTDASGHPIVNLRGAQHLTATLTGDNTQYHDYVLNYEPVPGKAKLFVDGKPVLFDYVGFVNPNHPSVGFGDATISDGGHALYELVEWTNCTNSTDGAACQLGIAYEPHIEYRSDPYPGLVDGYPTQAGKQTWTLGGLGNLDGKPVVDNQNIACWDNDNTGDTGHEEFWTLAPTPEDIALAQQRGWTLSTRMRLPSTNDSVGPGVGLYYADGAKQWIVLFGTASNGDPIVGVQEAGANIRSFTLDRQGAGNTEYHTYSLRYDRVAGTADLFVDNVERISDYAGYPSTQSARVVFGDLALGDSGRGQYNTVEWATCTAADLATCPADTGRIRYSTDPDPRTQNGYVFGRTPQLWVQNPAGSASGYPFVDHGSLVWDVVGVGGFTTWSQTPTPAEVAVAKMAGFALTTRLSMQSRGDPTDTGPFAEYADGAKLWRMRVGTDDNADPIVELLGDGPIVSYTVVGGQNAQHTYVLKQSPGAQGVDLLVDGVTRVSGFAGKTDSQAARVGFGTRLGDGGHTYVQFVGWGTPSFPGCMPGTSCCGDGIRDLGTGEECDTGSAPGNVICSSSCKVDDFLVVQPPAQPVPISMPTLRPNRTLGTGRHTIAGNAHTFGVAYTEEAPSPASVRLQVFTSAGQRRLNAVMTDGPALLHANPVVAPLPGERYAVAWNDFGADIDGTHGDELGVALRLVDSHSALPADLQHANTTTSFSQHDPDILWTGTELVVAWVDDFNAQTGPDLRYRIYDNALAPQSQEQALATSPDAEADVALAKFGATWAAAWRAGKDGLETIHVKTGTTEWTVGPFLPGPADDKPGLAEIDATHLLLAYTEGTDPAGTGVANGSKLRTALLDTAAPGLVPGLAVYPLAQPPSAGFLGQSQPDAVRVGNQWFLAWRSDAIPGDALGEDLWLKPVKLSTAHGLLDLSATESPLPRQPEHLMGDQRHVSLAELPPAEVQQSMLLSAWDDLGTTFGATEAQGDVVAQVVPLPVPPPSAPTCTGIDLNTSSQNCGACGHDCLGGTCQAGQCQPVAWVTGFTTLMGVVVVGSDVYVVDAPVLGQPPGPLTQDGTLTRIGPDGKKTVLESGFADGASSLWFDQTTSSFLWVGFSSWRAATRPLEAPPGSIATLFTNQLNFPFGIVSNADTIFLSNWGYLSIDPAHPEIKTLDTLQRRSRSTLTQYEEFQLTDSVPQENHPFHASHFDIDDTYVYWTESQTGNVVRRPIATPFSAGRSANQVLTNVPANARGLAVDKSTLFITTYGQPDASPPGMVFRAANQPGAVAVKMADVPGNLEDVAVDAKALYIAGRTSGTVWKLAR